MDTESKVKKYNKLVENINRHDLNELSSLSLVPSENCTEVNYWTYWEGGREHLDADILLVGQDWGSIDYKDEPIASLIQNNPALATSSFVYMENNKNKTNEKVCELLASLYPNVNFKKDFNTQKQLFFTNFVPWYRKPGARISKDFQEKWLDLSAPYFKELVEIIAPKIIMCLGAKTYTGVCNSLEIAIERGKTYTKIIEERSRITTIDNNEIHVFPLMHPGYYGTINRSLDKQRKDWEKVKDLLEQLNN